MLILAICSAAAKHNSESIEPILIALIEHTVPMGSLWLLVEVVVGGVVTAGGGVGWGRYGSLMVCISG